MQAYLDGVRPYLLLGALCLALFAPGMTTLPAIDRDEARFAQATKQMLESGDFVRIRFQEQPRNKKPVGAYWLQAASVAAFSDPDSRAIWPYRLPSAVGATIAVLLTFGLGRALVGRRSAFVAAALLASAVVTVVDTHMAKSDALLLATVVAAPGARARLDIAARGGAATGPGPPALFWAALALGVLIKGPIGPMIAALTFGALKAVDRGVPLWRSLRPLWGVPLAAAIAAPWFVAITLVADGGFVGAAVRDDLLPKLIGGVEAHGFPPGYFLLLLSVTFWPGSLFVWHGLVQGWRARAAPAVRFCLAWIVPAWIVFELVPTKLPHYVLPLYPAVALLVGKAVTDAAENLVPRLAAWESRLAYLVWALVGLALGGAVVAVPIAVDGDLRPASLIAAVAALTVAGVGLRMAWRGQIGAALAVGIAASAAIHASALHSVLPRVDGIWLSDRAIEMARRAAPGRPLIAAAGYIEPSLVFLAGTDLRLTSGAGAAERLRARPDGLVLVDDGQEAEFRAALTRLGAAARSVASARGFNYSKGRWTTITLYAAGPDGER